MFSVHLLEIRAGGYSSEHKHFRKVNHFHVIRGEMEIVQWPENAVDPDRTTLRAGDGLTVPVGQWHQFRAITDCLCVETYEAAPVEDDIIRRSVGGSGGDPDEPGLP